MAEAVEVAVGERRWQPRWLVVRPVDDDLLEIVFSALDDEDVRGMQVARATLDAARGRLAGSSMEEIAFDLATTFVVEPRALAEFEPADASGVRWLPFSDWIDEVS